MEIDWYDAGKAPLSLYGFEKEENGLISCRIPQEIARNISDEVYDMRAYGAGGRIRFGTDSGSVWIKAEYGTGRVPTICSYCFSYGFDLYLCDQSGKENFCHTFRIPEDFDGKTFSSVYQADNGSTISYYTLNFPCFAEVTDFRIGIERGSKLTAGKSYVNDKPVIFYGSSITHGVAASRPGNTYEAFLSQKYNVNYLNYGFAGAARGELQMAEYLAGKAMSAFVCDYDHNAEDVGHLQKTHYSFYEKIRERHPDISYIMISRPDFFKDPKQNSERRAVIMESYERAQKCGDSNVYFIDGETLFEGAFAQSCTVDGCHPNDLGFYRMAEKIGGQLTAAGFKGMIK